MVPFHRKPVGGYYRVGSEEEFRIQGFEKILLTPMWFIAALHGKFERGTWHLFMSISIPTN